MSSEWQSYQLGALFELVNGFAFKGGDFKSSGIPVIKIKNVKPNKLLLSDLAFVDSNVADKRPDKELKRGDILITMSGNRMDGSRDTWVGKVAYFDIPGRYMLNQRVGVLRPKEGVEVDRRCCSYFLSSDGFQDFFIAVATSSGGQANLSPSQILGEKINLPPLAEQKLIASLLTALDDRIALLRDTSATLEVIAQALFKSWFVDFDPVRAKMAGRAPEGMDEATAALFPDSFEESELGLVPKGWRVGTLADVASYQNGYAFKTKDWSGVGHPVIKIGNVKPGIIETTGASYVLPETIVGLDRFRLQRGDLLVGMTGYVGETGLVPEIEPAAYLNQRVGKISTESGISDLGFVYCIVRNPAYKTHAESKSHGSAQANVSGTDLMSYPTVLPSTVVLDVFNQILAVFIWQILVNYEESQSLAALRDTLLPRLISGQLDLTPNG